MTFDEAVPVVLRDVPLAVLAQAEDHHDELLREFALISLGRAGDPATDLPDRLRALTARHGERFPGVDGDTERQRALALARGAAHADLSFAVLPAAARQAAELLALLEEADQYCRQGTHLLTLAAPANAARLRRWYLTQVIDQVAGRAPVSWLEYRD